MSHPPDPRTAELAAAYNPEYEPAHDNPHAHHGHFIVPGSTLLLVFIALLVFTLLTVGAAKAEEAIAHGFGIIIPQWVNVLVALSIAVVKTALVIGFFMQLRYDNPLNTMVFAFTVVCVFCFFGFTFTDLANRATIDRFKAEYIVKGGTGVRTTLQEEVERQKLKINPPADKQPITATSRIINDQLLELHSPLAIDPHEGHGDAAHGHGHAAAPKGSTPNRSRPLKGLTGLTGAVPAGDHGHADPHPAPADEHKPAAPAAPPAGH